MDSTLRLGRRTPVCRSAMQALLSSVPRLASRSHVPARPLSARSFLLRSEPGSGASDSVFARAVVRLRTGFAFGGSGRASSAIRRGVSNSSAATFLRRAAAARGLALAAFVTRAAAAGAARVTGSSTVAARRSDAGTVLRTRFLEAEPLGGSVSNCRCADSLIVGNRERRVNDAPHWSSWPCDV